MYVRYLRDEKRMPYGVVVGLCPCMIGWAVCNTDCSEDRAILAHTGKRGLKERAINRLMAGLAWQEMFSTPLLARQPHKAFLMAEIARAYFYLRDGDQTIEAAKVTVAV